MTAQYNAPRMATTDPVAPTPALARPDPAHVSDAVGSKLPFNATFRNLIPLAGDASNRRYFRIELDASPARSVILMQLAEPEAFKQSEEAVSGSHAVNELPFLNIHRHLLNAGVAVPALYHYDQAAGLLYLEDLGDLTLFEACRASRPDELELRYRQAIDGLVRIQLKASAPAHPGILAFHRHFDVPLLMWEFDHFVEYGIEARHGQPVGPDDRRALRDEFQKISELLAGEPRVFVHRDYHSRNLMVGGDRLGIIDFQDALMGPASYDLASLLRDAYIALDEALIDRLLAYYLDHMDEWQRTRANRDTFRRVFDFTSIQRNLKAAGRFVYIDRIKGNPKFLADIPRTLGYVKRNLLKYPELGALRTLMSAYVPELR
ncbi:putative Phosphotransferase [Nitrospira sp. KM1]|nr:putative Phosphotransferase [Nitrospira sp. KM1]